MGAALARGGLAEYAVAAVSVEFVELALQGLVGGADAGVADELPSADLLSWWRPGPDMTKSRIENRLRDVESGTRAGGHPAPSAPNDPIITKGPAPPG